MDKVSTQKRVLATVVTVAALAVLGGCGGGSTDSPSADGATPTPGGDLVIVQGKGTKTLDPVAAISPEDIAPMYELYDTLYRLSADGQELQPSLAAAAPRSSADGTKWTIELRDDASFSDGSPVTAADVAYSLNRARTANGAFSFLLGAITAVDAPDDHTVVITTGEPSATLEAVLGSWIASVLPADLGGQPEKAFFEDPVGSGPFQLDAWDRGQSLRLTKSTDYWQEGKPYLDSIQWTTVPDANTRVSQVQSGQADVASDVPFSQVASLESAADVTAGTFPAAYTSMLIFNQEYGPFADVHVRRAIAQAIDREAVTTSTLFGAGVAACSILPPSMRFASEPTCPTYNPEAAKAELAKSAYPDGFDVELTIDNLPESSTVAQAVQSQLAELGINVDIKVVDSGELYTVFFQEAYQMGLAAWASDIADPDEQLSYMLDPNAGGNAYYTGFDDPEVTRLIEQGRTTLDDSARADDYAQVQQIVADQVPQLPISHRENAYVWNRDLAQFEVNPMGMIDLASVGMVQQ